jgi:hypothetical protein
MITRAIVLVAALGLAASQAHAKTTACDVKLNVTDPDPAGLNVRAAPDAKVLIKFPDDKDPSELPKAEALGCDGSFLKVRVSGVVGWTQQFCSNQLTTCN